MTAFDRFQNATTFIAEGRRAEARREIVAAINWIDRTGRDRHVRADLVELLACLELWRNDDGTWSHHRDAQRRFQRRDDAATDLRFHLEWNQHP